MFSVRVEEDLDVVDENSRPTYSLLVPLVVNLAIPVEVMVVPREGH